MKKVTRNDPVVFHFRIGKGAETEPKAGATVVFLPEVKRFGVALCCHKDRYCKRWGRKIATERAKNGPRSRIQTRRFTCSPQYIGPVEIKAIKASAQALAYEAAARVNNPLVNEGSVFIDAEERAAMDNVGIGRE